MARFVEHEPYHVGRNARNAFETGEVSVDAECLKKVLLEIEFSCSN